MLSEQIGEFSGKVTGQRVLDVEGPIIESYQISTYWFTDPNYMPYSKPLFKC
jgi:hypothetical protein